jgi:ureidoglycolate hydrolase
MSKISNEQISIEEFSGEGLKRVAEYEEWFVGVKNYKPFNDVDNLKSLERHLLTDEVFVLLDGKCILLVDSSSNQKGTDIECIPMEKGKVYCIHKGIWHNTITTKDAKLILVENRNTSGDNSEMFDLSNSQIKSLISDLKKKYL